MCGQKCARLWREARLDDKMLNTKKWTRLWLEACSELKCEKRTTFGRLLEVEMLKKVHATVARSTSRSQTVENVVTAPVEALRFQCF